MPKVDNSILSSKEEIISDIKKIINPDNVLSHKDEIKPYETDALAAYRQTPLLVVLPETVEEVSQILKYCNENKIKVVPRGAGTGLSGGSLPLADCVLLAMGKFNKILELDSVILMSKFYPWIIRYTISKGLNPDEPRYLTKVTQTF